MFGKQPMVVDAEAACIPPPLWYRVVVDLQWIACAKAEQEQAEALINEKNLSGLLELQPKGSDILQKLQAPAVEHGVAHLRHLAQQATHGVEQVDEVSASASKRIVELLARVQAADPLHTSAGLEERRRGSLKKVFQCSAALQEVDLESEETPTQILSRAYSPEHVEVMSEDDKFGELEKLARQRASARQQTAIASAEELLRVSGEVSPSAAPPPLAVDISTAGESSVEQLQCQASTAVAMKQEAQDTTAGLLEILEERRRLLAECKAQKREAAEAMIQRRSALKKKLLDLKEESDQHDQAYQRNEILRLQEKDLTIGIEEVEEELQLAVPACREVEAACAEWRERAEEQAQAVHRQQTDAAASAVERTKPVLVAEALNLEVGLRLSRKVLQDQEAQVSTLQRAREVVAAQMNTLKAEVKGPGSQSKRRQLLQKKERLAELESSICRGREACEELALSINTAESRRRSLEALSVHGLCLQETELAQQAADLVDEAYVDGLSLPSVAEEAEGGQADPGSALALTGSTTMASMVQEAVKVALLQERADREIRGRQAQDQDLARVASAVASDNPAFTNPGGARGTEPQCSS